MAAQAQSTMARDTLEKQLKAAAARLRATALGGLSSGGLRAPVPFRMLHECFLFRDSAHDQAASAADALEVMAGASPARLTWSNQKSCATTSLHVLWLAGDKLGVAVVETTEQAKAVLEWLAASPQRQQCRIWPVEALHTNDDQLARQRAAQSHFPEGDTTCHAKFLRADCRHCPDRVCAVLTGNVIVPLDLLEPCELSMQPLLTRAFSMLIARTDEVAAVLASRFRLASVTLGGRISRPGTLQGGWRGGTLSAARHMMARKLRHDMLQVCSSASIAWPQCRLSSE